MTEKNDKTVNEQYLDLVKKKIESVQQSGEKLNQKCLHIPTKGTTGFFYCRVP